MKFIDGGVTAAQGFTAGGIHCGIRKNKQKPDLAMIYSETRCAAGAVYTTNLVKGAPILVTQENIKDGHARAVVCNSGNANTCNADGVEKAQRMCALTGEALGIAPEEVVVASTGVIGQVLPIEPLEEGIPALAKELSPNGSNKAATAIMTTDTFPKEVAVELEVGGAPVRIGGIAKGSGMIHPNMATMLSFLTTDCAISPAMLQKAIKQAADATFNMITVDGDTSTNDTFAVLANGLAKNQMIDSENEGFAAFCAGLETVARRLSQMLASDGEGATKLLTCRVAGGASLEEARGVARCVVGSSLVKAAMFGSDANWGRVLCAIGYSGWPVDVNKIDVSFASKEGRVDVCKDGAGVDFSEELASRVLGEKDVEILVKLQGGAFSAEAYGCDLTYDYVKINGDYRT